MEPYLITYFLDSRWQTDSLTSPSHDLDDDLQPHCFITKAIAELKSGSMETNNGEIHESLQATLQDLVNA